MVMIQKAWEDVAEDIVKNCRRKGQLKAAEEEKEVEKGGRGGSSAGNQPSDMGRLG